MSENLSLVQFYGHAAANALRQMQAAARKIKDAESQQMQVSRENSGAVQIQTSRLAQ
ncbi:hypothetical protein J4896_000605 [Escherichia coli]|uniref:hypothetical protein n=1 Tax=Escherichia coli TaxID=562 RepID=UPI00176EDF38|nr:hypothetical protein [Escherichia coli]EHC1747238.1 hypothetical protein [Escherichia coli]EHH7738733.1 hypothetical protein [Escherichia coli]HAI2186785.1 hypothetical protein [Escherichia coli]